MAKATTSSSNLKTTKKKRKGVHSKKKNSVSPAGKNYKKKYRGQGR